MIETCYPESLNHVSFHDFICTKIDTSSASISSFPDQKSLSFKTHCYEGWFLVRAACSANWEGARLGQFWSVPGEGKAKGWSGMWEGRTTDRICSQRWPGWVPMFVLSVRVQRGPLTWPKSSPWMDMKMGQKWSIMPPSSTPDVTVGRVWTSCRLCRRCT